MSWTWQLASSQPQATNAEEMSDETVYLERRTPGKKVAGHKGVVKENLNFFTYTQEVMRNMVK